jgi:ankyrin repeat protein
MRAIVGNDMEVIRALLAKGASPNINDMGLTPFLVSAGVGTSGGRGGTGLAQAAGANGSAKIPLMELLIQHGADVNAQVTGTKTYSMRISRAPSSNEGMTALHIAAQSGNAEIVKFLIDKGASTGIVDGNGRKPIDLVGTSAPGNGGRGGGAPAPPTRAGTATAPPAPPATGARGGPGRLQASGAASAANVAEIRAMLTNAGSGR